MLIYFLIVLFICLLVVIAVLFLRFASGCNNLFFLKLGHNNHGLIFNVVTLGLLRDVETVGLLWVVETVGLLRAVETLGLLWVVETMGLLRAVSSMGLIRAYDQLPKHGPITYRFMAVNGLELESSVHGPTIMSRR